jgi:hypothetical protein
VLSFDWSDVAQRTRGIYGQLTDARPAGDRDRPAGDHEEVRR